MATTKQNEKKHNEKIVKMTFTLGTLQLSRDKLVISGCHDMPFNTKKKRY